MTASWCDLLSAEDAGHLAVAVRLYRHSARAQGIAVPSTFAAYETELASRAMKGQEGTPLDDLWAVAKPGPMPTPPRLLTIQEAAYAMHMSLRTAKRRVAEGTLPSVKVGGLTRVRVGDLDAYLERLGGEAC